MMMLLLTYTFHHLLIQRKFFPSYPPIRYCLIVTLISIDDSTQLPLEPIDNVDSSSPTPQTPSTSDVVFTEESSSTHTSNINTTTTAINLPVTHEQLHAKKFYSSNPILRGSKDTE